MTKLEENKYINYAIENDCSKCKYGKDGHYTLGLYFCKCRKKQEASKPSMQ